MRNLKALYRFDWVFRFLSTGHGLFDRSSGRGKPDNRNHKFSNKTGIYRFCLMKFQDSDHPNGRAGKNNGKGRTSTKKPETSNQTDISAGQIPHCHSRGNGNSGRQNHESNKRGVTTAFLFPIVFLAGAAALNEYDLRTGQTLVLPVEGYDPRDLLSGHYLRYKIDYGLKCPLFKETRRRAYICFEPKKYITVSGPPDACSLFIRGRCSLRQKTFHANIERYYIPEKQAKETERAFTRAEKKSVVLSVTRRGRALVQDILIDEKSLSARIRQ